MKNLIIYTGIALVVLANIDSTVIIAKKEVAKSKETRNEIVVARDFKTEYLKSKKFSSSISGIVLNSRTFILSNFTKIAMSKTIIGEEPIEVFSTNKMNRTVDELIAEDNLITENNISNETQALDFNIVNSISQGDEVVESVHSFKTEKTADEIITEDNLITENNISIETQALDFNIINSISEGDEVVEPVHSFKTEKTAGQCIAEDNVLTENNISNETQALDFNVINDNTIGQ